MRRSGFTLIELMVAMVVGLTVITSVYSLGSAMSRQFYEEQRVAIAQGTSRVAIMELRRDISRAGLYGSPNASLESTCDTVAPTLPQLGGGTGPMGAFQYYADEDLTVLDPNSLNSNVHADRLRILTSLYLSDQLLVHSTSTDGTVIVLQTGNQAYRRTFSWGQVAGPFTSGAAPNYLTGALDWNSAWSGETASWKGIAQKGARAFQTGSVLHIETPEGRHFFRSVFGKMGNTQDEVRIQIDTNFPLPVGTACLPGAAEGATIAPLQWVEYAVVDPFATGTGDVGADFMDWESIFFIDTSPGNPALSLRDAGASSFEAPNRVLVRRAIDAATGDVRLNSTQVVAEFVTNFEVSFLLDTTSGTAAPTLDPSTGSSAESDVNANPQQVRAVIIELGIRSPLEDPTVTYGAVSDAGTRFEVDDGQTGSARVRQVRIEIPVMNVARRNL
ncbi:MAG: prepilin-type N-terminal cleavage/methylation domain-containing protein [Deltaproteobacteria bacterium]|nr:prepilin-type N-terminal cleavage/methylation domain-containing protein [Deltaproteobacteria bacterium]MBW2547486.1 prepilin-type N-terminal cleavage/methylation domain-containing protein [Deltaproteobacteria bacterium]MBW2719104.1 prepilin-type N-terminal cleavage/methylation domain-containing protein [Deltaproteobacteria bacterium]